MQKKRGKEENRYIFTVDEKRDFLKRTKGKCARCGKELKVGTKDCTVEHIIPLSKGGKNEPSNLICMCKKCNLDKGNDIVEPSWYKYLNKDELPTVERLFMRYLKEYCHMSNNNLLPVDQYTTVMRFNAKTGDIFCDKSGKIIEIKKEIVWKRANAHDDFEKIVEAYKHFNKKHNVVCDDVKKRVSYLIRKCCVYYIESADGDVKAIVPFALADASMGVDDKMFIYGSAKAHKLMPCIFFIDPVNCTSKRVYDRVIMDFFQYILANIMTSLDVDMFRNTGIAIRTNHFEGELRLHCEKEAIWSEKDSIAWDTFTCKEVGDLGTRLEPKDIDAYIKKVTAKLKELGITLKDIDTILQRG